mmetsp:Transcript_30342/g.66712  ORF Transcript_30342/g.66712 Transcript_30342/m.66712 type:complete len:650 (+) Transcript_30342:117-2066(+)
MRSEDSFHDDDVGDGGGYSYDDDDYNDDEFDESFELLGGGESRGGGARSRGEPLAQQQRRRHYNPLASSSSSLCSATHIKLAVLGLVAGLIVGYLVLLPSGNTNATGGSEVIIDDEFVQKVQMNRGRYFGEPNVVMPSAGTEGAAAEDSSLSKSSSESSSDFASRNSEGGDNVLEQDMNNDGDGGVGVGGVDVKQETDDAAGSVDGKDGDGSSSSSGSGSSGSGSGSDDKANDSQVEPSSDGASSESLEEGGNDSDDDASSSTTMESTDGTDVHDDDDAAPTAPTTIHPQCVDPNTLTNSQQLSADRPILILKYARTGSTWLVWSGQTLKLSNNRTMIWTSEAEGCGQPYSDDLMKWFIEYYHPTDRDTRMRLNNRPNYLNNKCKLYSGRLYINYEQGHKRKHNRQTELGSFVSTIDWKIATKDIGDNGNETLTTLDWHTDDPFHRKGDNVLGKDIPDLTLTQWGQLFQSVPNLALGVLVRTNSVKRAVSRLASEDQERICGSKKLRGDEECLKDLPDKVYINTTQLWDDIKVNDMKRDILPKMVAHLSTTFGNAKIYCLSYESMQRDMAGQMAGLGKFLGADIEPSSLDKLREGAGNTSYKRGSDDLSEYLENYDEVRESLSDHPCLLAQLEDKSKGDDFPPCNVWQR